MDFMKDAGMEMVAYEKGDACFGKVSGRNRAGAYILLDNNEIGFSFQAANLREGTRVICTIVKAAMAEKKALVNIDSVCYQYAA